MSGPHPSSSRIRDKTDGKVPLKKIIQAFLQKNEFLHEFRLQKLIYIADLVAKLDENRGQRLTDADFRPYMYGSYSEDVRKTLNSLKEGDELPHKRDRQYGKVTTVYLGEGHNSVQKTQLSPDISTEDMEIISTVSKATRDWSSEDLGDWSKGSWLYKNTPYEEEMDFSRIDLVRDNVKADLIDNFPGFEGLLL